jgi:abhydrolase domain-containing protein 6
MATERELKLGALQQSLAFALLKRACRLKPITVRVGHKAMPTLVRGRGAPIVLVHGFGADKEGWLTLIAALDKRRAVVALDVPGFGASTPIDWREASPKRQAEAVVGAMAQLGIDKAHLVGSSMGGGISQRIAQDHPERVLSMTLLGTAATVGEKSELGHALDRGDNPLLAQSPEDFLRLVDWMTVRKVPAPRTMLLYAGSQRMKRTATEEKLFEGFAYPPESERMPEDFASILAPTLVIHGDKDPVIHPATARMLGERLPHVTVDVMTGIGHLPHIEATRAVAAHVNAFTRMHDPPILGR